MKGWKTKSKCRTGREEVGLKGHGDERGSQKDALRDLVQRGWKQKGEGLLRRLRSRGPSLKGELPGAIHLGDLGGSL